MLALHPDANVQNAVATLADLASRASTIAGSEPDPLGVFNAYLGWSVTALRSLTRVLDTDSVRALIETTPFRIIHAIDPAAYSRPALGDLVRTELQSRVDALEAARLALTDEIERWTFRGERTKEPTQHAAVLDTNTIMEFSGRIEQIQWDAILQTSVGEPITVVIPIMVLRELDTLKHSNGTMLIADDAVPRRTLARAAIRVLDRAFPGDSTLYSIRGSRTVDNTVQSPLRLLLQLDDLRHASIPDPDAEIIDRALSLRPLVSSLTLITGDISMRVRAEHSGLRAAAGRPHA